MKLQLLRADITQVSTDAIVNAANSSLLGGGGVDGAIHRAGGPAILEACMAIRDRQGGCETGEAVITPAGRLPARYVIHTVGPVWSGDKDEKRRLLARCYTRCLEVAAVHGCGSIAFPNISTGIYGFPKGEAAAIAVSTVQAFSGAGAPERAVFVCYDEENFRLYQALLS